MKLYILHFTFVAQIFHLNNKDIHVKKQKLVEYDQINYYSCGESFFSNSRLLINVTENSLQLLSPIFSRKKKIFALPLAVLLPRRNEGKGTERWMAEI